MWVVWCDRAAKPVPQSLADFVLRHGDDRAITVSEDKTGCLVQWYRQVVWWPGPFTALLCALNDQQQLAASHAIVVQLIASSSRRGPTRNTDHRCCVSRALYTRSASHSTS